MKQYAENLTALPAKGDPARTREGIANPPARAYLTRRSFAYAFGSDARDARAWIKGESGESILDLRFWILDCLYEALSLINPKSEIQNLKLDRPGLYPQL